jgi:hypothetical protein
MNESRCRVTGVDDKAHLRASQITPWKDCTNTEKVHGCNGLLLAPHVDHLSTEAGFRSPTMATCSSPATSTLRW